MASSTDPAGDHHGQHVDQVRSRRPRAPARPGASRRPRAPARPGASRPPPAPARPPAGPLPRPGAWPAPPAWPAIAMGSTSTRCVAGDHLHQLHRYGPRSPWAARRPGAQPATRGTSSTRCTPMPSTWSVASPQARPAITTGTSSTRCPPSTWCRPADLQRRDHAHQLDQVGRPAIRWPACRPGACLRPGGRLRICSTLTPATSSTACAAGGREAHQLDQVGRRDPLASASTMCPPSTRCTALPDRTLAPSTYRGQIWAISRDSSSVPRFPSANRLCVGWSCKACPARRWGDPSATTWGKRRHGCVQILERNPHQRWPLEMLRRDLQATFLTAP